MGGGAGLCVNGCWGGRSVFELVDDPDMEKRTLGLFGVVGCHALLLQPDSLLVLKEKVKG